MFSTRRLVKDPAQMVLATSNGKYSGSLTVGAGRPTMIVDWTDPARGTTRIRRAPAAGGAGVGAGASPAPFHGPNERVTAAETAAPSTSPTTTRSAPSGRKR